MTKVRFPSVLAPRIPPALHSVDLHDLEPESTFEEASVSGSVLDIETEYIEFTSSRVSGVAFTGSVLDNLSMVDVVVEDCEFSGVSLEDTTLTRVEFRQCRMTGLSGPGLKARDIKFVNCKLDSANFHMSTWERCEFVDCELQGIEFNSAALSSTQFRDCRLERAEFAQARLNDVSFHGSTLEVIGGAAGMRGAVIGSEQVAALATSVFAALGIEVNDSI